MATADTVLLTADEFWDWCRRPENAERRCELVLGELVDMPPPSALHGVVVFLVARLLGNYLFTLSRGWICTNDTGLVVSRGPDTVRGADLMLFMSAKPFAKVSRRYPDEVPELVVEVLSPSDLVSRVNKKIEQYLKAGVAVVWLVDPELRIVTVYRRGEDFRTLDETDELSDPAVLPGFACKVAELFALPGEG